MSSTEHTEEGADPEGERLPEQAELGPEPEPEGDRLPAGPKDVGIPRSGVGVAEVVGGIFVAIGVSVLGIMIVSIFDPSLAESNGGEQSEGGLLAVQAFLAVGLFGAAIGATIYANKGDGLLAALRRLGMRSFGLRAIGTMLAALGIYLLAALVIAGIFSPEQEDIAENLGADQDAEVLITVLAGILIVPVAALAEELFFRGLLFGGLRQRIGLWPAAAISGALFGVGHLTAGDAAVALQLTVFGMILAWAYERSGTIWVPIILHGSNNALAFYLLVTDKI